MKSIFRRGSKKKLWIFLILNGLYLISFYLYNELIAIDSMIVNFLAKDYPNEVVQNYMESQRKWWWVSYALIPVLIGIKVLLVAFCLNFVKLFDLPGLQNVKFGGILELVLLAEFIFVGAGIYKFANFYWFEPDYTLQDLQTYYPLSLLNFSDSISTEKWLAYPLQVANLFEASYWGILAYGLWELAERKISYWKSLGVVAVTYGVGLFFWVGVVAFLILNAQY